MQIHEIQRNTPNKKPRRVGRGGKHVKTSGRGTKGQKSRAGHRMRPEMRDMIKRIPKLRGRGKNSNLSISDKAAAVNLEQLERLFQVGEAVNPKTLLAKGLIRRIDGSYPTVKILARGAVTKKLSVTKCLVSASAKAALEKVGGTVA